MRPGADFPRRLERRSSPECTVSARIERVGIGENGCRFLEGDAVLAKVMKSLRGIQENIFMYIR